MASVGRFTDAVNELMVAAVDGGVPPSLKVIAARLGVDESTASRYRSKWLSGNGGKFPNYKPYKIRNKGDNNKTFA